jgi:hypothetical protein
LAREPAYRQFEVIRNSPFGDGYIDVIAAMVRFGPAMKVHLCGVLSLRGGLPLVAPDDVEPSAFEFSVGVLKPDPKPSDSGEKLDYTDARRG